MFTPSGQDDLRKVKKGLTPVYSHNQQKYIDDQSNQIQIGDFSVHIQTEESKIEGETQDNSNPSQVHQSHNRSLHRRHQSVLSSYGNQIDQSLIGDSKSIKNSYVADQVQDNIKNAIAHYRSLDQKSVNAQSLKKITSKSQIGRNISNSKLSNFSLQRDESNSIFLQQNRIMKSISRSNAHSALGAYSAAATPNKQQSLQRKYSSVTAKSDANRVAQPYQRRSDIKATHTPINIKREIFDINARRKPKLPKIDLNYRELEVPQFIQKEHNDFQYNLEKITNLGGKKTQVVNVKSMRDRIDMLIMKNNMNLEMKRKVSKKKINQGNGPQKKEVNSDESEYDTDVDYEREYDFTKDAKKTETLKTEQSQLSRQFNVTSPIESVQNQMKKQFTSVLMNNELKSNLVIDVNKFKSALTFNDQQPTPGSKIKKQVEKAVQFKFAGSPRDILPLNYNIERQKDFSADKYPDFVPQHDHEKYYIDKKDYCIPEKVKTKGNEKYTPAVRSLIQKRNAFKNKYQQMSFLEDHFINLTKRIKNQDNFKKRLQKGLSQILQGPQATNRAPKNLGEKQNLQPGESPFKRKIGGGAVDKLLTELSEESQDSDTLSEGSPFSSTKLQKNQSYRILEQALDLKNIEDDDDQETLLPDESANQSAELRMQRNEKEISKIHSNIKQLMLHAVQSVHSIDSRIRQNVPKISDGSPLASILNDKISFGGSDSGQQSPRSENSDDKKLQKINFVMQQQEFNPDNFFPDQKQSQQKDLQNILKNKIQQKLAKQFREVQTVTKALDSINEDQKKELSPKYIQQNLNKALKDAKPYDEQTIVKNTRDKIIGKDKLINNMYFKDERIRYRKKFAVLQEGQTYNAVDYPSSDDISDEEMAQLDQIDLNVTDERAIFHQQQLFKNLDKLDQEYNYKGKQMKSPLMNFMTGIQNSKEMVLPKNFGFLHKNNHTQMNLKSFYIKKEYVQPFVKSIQLSSQLLKLDLTSTQLTTWSCQQLSLNIPYKLIELNISKNPNIGPLGILSFCQNVLNDQQYQLQSFILANCNAGDKGAACIGKALEDQNILRFLDLSDNGITFIGAQKLSEGLLQNECLSVLFLHWNLLGYKGGHAIARALTSKNSVLQVLDLSFCNLGQQKQHREKPAPKESQDDDAKGDKKKGKKEEKKEAPKGKGVPLTPEQIIEQQKKEEREKKRLKAEAEHYAKLPPRKKAVKIDIESAEIWSEAFLKNQTLIHLDLSHNNFDSRELTKINEGLDQNHTLLGLHLAGNEGATDALGFVKPQDIDGIQDQEDVSNHVIFTRMQPNLRIGTIKNPVHIRMQAQSNCWICEGWTEFKFDYIPKKKVDTKICPVKLHVSCDNFEGELLAEDLGGEQKDVADALVEKNLTMKNVAAQQMMAGILSKGLTVKTQEHEIHDQSFTVTRMMPPGQVSYYYSVDNVNDLDKFSDQIDAMRVEKAMKLLELNVPKTNIIKNIIQKRLPITQTYLTNMEILPRTERVNLAGRMQLKTPWDFSKSVFKPYRPDNQKIIDECFEIDWPGTKCEKIIKGDDQISAIKFYIKSNYKHLRETYKYYSGIAPLGRLMSMSSPTLGEMLSHCNGFVDMKVIKISDVDLSVIAANGGKRVTNWLSPDKNIVRAQLIEVLVRLALDKYLKTGIVKTQAEAVKMAFEKNFLDHFQEFDCHHWRKTFLWKEEMDLLYTRLLSGLKQVYQKNSGKYAQPGAQSKTMSLDEFIDMFDKGHLIDENFGQREIGVLFNVSMMTNKYELESEKHLNMTFVEFLEAIARCADKFENGVLRNFVPEMKAKQKSGLDKKIESICFMLMQTSMTEKGFKSAFDSYCKAVEIEISNPGNFKIAKR